ncbi:hypothetical protein ACK3Z6_19320, partial [Aeromonas caviae]
SKQESGIKRRSSHFSCVNTVPVNTYLRNVQLQGAFGDVPAGASSTGVAATGAGFARQPRR